MRTASAILSLVMLLLFGVSATAQNVVVRPADGTPTIAVNGRGEAAAKPDRAVVRLGATAQAKEAAAAQNQVNQVVERAIADIRKLGIADENIQTVGLHLYPVHGDMRPRPGGEPAEPRIVGYRASNTISVRVDDIKRIGDVIDAAVSAGANELQGVNFELKNDTPQRSEALRKAVREARTKAQAIAEAMDMNITGVSEVIEGGMHFVEPPWPRPLGVRAAAMEADTPVQPGEVRVEATVTVRYRISPAGK